VIEPLPPYNKGVKLYKAISVFTSKKIHGTMFLGEIDHMEAKGDTQPRLSQEATAAIGVLDEFHFDNPQSISKPVNPRYASGRFREMVQKYADDNKQLDHLVADAEPIAKKVNQVLSELSRRESPDDPSIRLYAGYATSDIVRAIALIPAPAIQRILVSQLERHRGLEPNDAQEALTDPKATIFRETLASLFAMPDKRVSLGLSILKQNSTAGYEDKTLFPEVQNALLGLLSVEDADIQLETVDSICALYKHMNGELPRDLYDKSVSLLMERVGKVVKNMGTQEAIDTLVTDVASMKLNIHAALAPLAAENKGKEVITEEKMKEHVDEMTIVLPDDFPGNTELNLLEELKALPESQEEDSIMNDYRDLAYFIKAEARGKLSEMVSKEITTRKGNEKRRTEEEKREQNRRALKEKEEREEKEKARDARRIASEEERARAEKARKKFGFQSETT
jgi:hypothetical protein